jgi:hypothetical protein
MKNIFLLFVLIYSANTTAQNKFDIDQLTDKYWRIVSYELNGNYMSAENIVGAKDYAIWYKDHTARSDNRGNIVITTWSYNPENNILTSISDKQSSNAEMKVVKLNDLEFAFESIINGVTVKAVMKNVSQEMQ